jgi:hypothetical protein
LGLRYAGKVSPWVGLGSGSRKSRKADCT